MPAWCRCRGCRCRPRYWDSGCGAGKGCADCRRRRIAARACRGSRSVAQRFNLRRNDAQVFGNQREAFEIPMQTVQQRRARRGHPAAVDGAAFLRGYLPAGFEAPEMVDAHPVEQLQLALHAFPPPAEAVLLHAVPVKQGVAPALAQFGEVIRRYPGHHGLLALCVEQEAFAPCPDVGRIAGYEYGMSPYMNTPFSRA